MLNGYYSALWRGTVRWSDRKGAAFLIGFVPPSQYGSGNALSYVLLIGGGMGAVGLLVPYLFLRFRKPGWKIEVPQEALA